MFGFIVRNADDELLIDDNYLGYGVVIESNLILTTTPSIVSFPTTITSQALPIVAVQRWPYTGTYIDTFKFIGTPGNWTGFYTRISRNTSLFPQSPSSISVRYRVYVAGSDSVDQYGLRVKKSDSSTVIDTGNLQLGFDYSVSGGIESYPIVAQAAGGFQKEFIIAITNRTILASDWIPVSLVVSTEFIRNTVIFPSNTVQSTAALRIGPVCLNSSGNVSWSSPDMLGLYVYLEDLNGYAVQNYQTRPIPPTPIIRNR